MYCRICGTEEKIEFRARSKMILCNPCHKTTPAKVSRNEFLKAIYNAEGGLDQHQERILSRDFYPDYLVSTFESAEEYWRSCSA